MSLTQNEQKSTSTKTQNTKKTKKCKPTTWQKVGCEAWDIAKPALATAIAIGLGRLK